MSHTYVSALFHCVFSTKGRCGLIPPARQPDLWAYFGGIARKNGFKTLAVGGTDNHVHFSFLAGNLAACQGDAVA